MISEIEYKVLSVLNDNWKSLDEISNELNVDKYKVLRTLGFLKEKGLIELREEKIKRYELTEIGKKYLKEGLPERRLLNLLKEKKEINLEELNKYFDKDELSFSLGFLRKNGAIKIENGKVIYIKDIETYEKYLENIDENTIKLFKGRKGIIEEKEETIYYAKINDKGKEILKNYKPEEYIEKYTKEVIDKKIYKNKKFRPYDIRINIEEENIGRYNPYLEFLDKIREELISMGFKEMDKYSMIISHFWDLDSLFIPQDHPAGDISIMDAFYIKNIQYIEDFPRELFENVKNTQLKYFRVFDENISKRTMLISHDTAISARTLLNAEKPGKYFLIEKVFRYDTIDAKHFIEFNQLEGIVLDDNLTFLDLLGILKELVLNVVKAKNIKFYPAYFPFTEPSVEVYAEHPKLGWIEVGGAGVFREELLRQFNIDYPVLAWGLGVDRLATIYLNINDIRELHTRNIKKLQE
ncbi:phenylalanine--tRNA ligase subunit alpha [Candidatus Nanobsidianus stetteri]|uniref:phenylalanine--tRNA ligase n=1 Tax=Nanobsidianus stetteri TaxID=1294122 RepID=A0A2T9WM05_NANST|nr:phenylalanine--tRNA ligase subunit alpha [Candidatus Nanobsidianus stetteri]MCC5446872.1 phenylalanine--tRNA ligase subunit alpha [Candidatus Nanobsidianus stetteri]